MWSSVPPLCLYSIHATNDDRGRKGVSWTKEVTVFIRDITVQLLQDWLVKVCVYKYCKWFCAVAFVFPIHSATFFCLQVNGEVVTLPFLREPYIYIERQTNTILLNTNIGLKVVFGLFCLSFSLLMMCDRMYFVTLIHPLAHL